MRSAEFNMAPREIAVEPSSPESKSRAYSMSSDRASITGYGGLLSPPATVVPDAAFIAASAASQIVTNDHDSQADAWLDQHGIEPSGETALVSPPALRLVNQFLDQLLFNFLSASKSTSLASLRPAVTVVLKAKLAGHAVGGADQELREYLGGGEDEEPMAFHNALEPSGDWDLELVWKRTRLRCMVYSSLGDMEEEDEDYYTEQEHLDGAPGSTSLFNNDSGVVSPAVAIFLTSILEFMGEQVLVVAGQAAYYRQRTKHEKEDRDGRGTPADLADRVVVEEADMERVALDRTLGRLWRGWKKRVRSPTISSASRSLSPESHGSQYGSRAASVEPGGFIPEGARRASLVAVLSDRDPAALVPLPMGTDDVREIEVPGVASAVSEDEAGESDGEDALPQRPKSMMILSNTFQKPPTPHSSNPTSPVLQCSTKPRPLSMPIPPQSRYTPPLERSGDLLKEQLSDHGEGPLGQPLVASPIDSVEGKTREGHEPQSDDTGVINSIVANAAAIGTAAAAGIVAAVHGKAPQTTLKVDTSHLDSDLSDEEEEEEEEEEEAAEILTSARVSIGGRMSPEEAPHSTGISRRSSLRSPSTHSVRLIDVVAPMSPVSRSRDTSVEAAEHIGRSESQKSSRPTSIHGALVVEHQSPRVGSPVSRGPTASPLSRNGSALSNRKTRHSTSESITEVEEFAHAGENKARRVESGASSTTPSDLAAAMQGVYVDTAPASQFAIQNANRSPPRSAPFVLDPAPRTKNAPPPNDGQPSPGKTQAPPRSLAPDVGATPLTPVREKLESAAEPLDASSHVVGARSVHRNSNRDLSPSISNSHNSQTPRAPDHLKSQAQKVNRISPPRMADQLPRSQRPIHTSGSGSTSSSHHLKPASTREESADEGKSQSFEELIRSDQTIQYTLTPQNMRDIESPDSPHSSRNAAPAINTDLRPQTGRSRSPSISKLTGLHSNPPNGSPTSTKKSFNQVPRPASGTGSRLRPNAPQARDARVDRDSIGDFADFIRSTGPATSYDPTPLPAPSTGRPMNSSRRNMSISGTTPRVSTAASLPRRAESSAGRRKLQARDAVVPRGDSISDLIDFVRAGPQLDKESHRIPRTVAPFRTTMDSDQMSGAVGGKAIDASLPESYQDKALQDSRYSQTSASVTSSHTSQTHLIKNQPLPAQRQNEPEDGSMPKRKQRRVRDPYAIDFSDEEDESYSAKRAVKPIQEESLADFLRNVPPPPEPVEAPRPVTSKTLKKKPSTGSFMSRFSRKDSNTPSVPTKTKPRGGDSRPATNSAAAPKVPAYTPIAAKYSSPNPPPQTNNNNYVSQVDTERRKNKVVQKSYQPREAVYANTSRTNDLADFLMRSEPPSSMATQPKVFEPSTSNTEASGFSRMFGRKKVH